MGKVKVKGAFKKSRLFWGFYILGAILLTIGIALMPLWKDKNVFWAGLGDKFFSIVLFVFIFTYITGVLVKQIIKEKYMPVKILTIFEAGFFFAIAIGCIMEFLNKASLVDSCVIVGAALWSRGFVYIVKAYLYKHEKDDKYPLWMLIVSVGLVSIGSIMMVNKLFTDELIVWIVASLLVLASILCFIIGLIMKPAKDKAKLQKKKDKKKQKKLEKKNKKEQEKLEKKEQEKQQSLPEPVKQIEEPKKQIEAPKSSDEPKADKSKENKSDEPKKAEDVTAKETEAKSLPSIEEKKDDAPSESKKSKKAYYNKDSQNAAVQEEQ